MVVLSFKTQFFLGQISAMDVTLPHVLFKYISIFHIYLKLFCLVGNYFQWGKK